MLPETPNCDEAIELLPWLVANSLEEEERRRLLDHLAACPSCRRELQDTEQAWKIFDQHIPGLVLAQYALGLRPSGLDPDRIEQHLRLCPSCRLELAGVTSHGVADAETLRFPGDQASRPSRPLMMPHLRRVPHWRRSALAAGIAATLIAGGLAWRHLGSQPSALDHHAGRKVESTASTLFVDGFESGTAGAWKLASESEDDHEARRSIPTRKPTVRRSS